MRQTLRFLSVVLLGALLFSGKLSAAGPPVEPLLQKYCLGCHNDRDRESGLSLQTFDELKTGGDSGSLLAEDLSKSILLSVLSKDSDRIMPPVDEAQPTDKERDQLKQWVLSGARFAPIAVGRPNVPDMKPFCEAAAANSGRSDIARSEMDCSRRRPLRTHARPCWQGIVAC